MANRITTCEDATSPFTLSVTLTLADQAYGIALPRDIDGVILQAKTTAAKFAYSCSVGGGVTMGDDVHDLPAGIASLFDLHRPATRSKSQIVFLESTTAGQKVTVSGVRRTF